MNDIKNYFCNTSNVYYGHGIGLDNLETVKSIFKNGLRCSHEQLYYTTEVLGPGSENLFDKIENKLNNWKHNNSSQIVIISLPIKYIIPFDGSFYGKKEAAFYKTVSNEEIENLNILPGLYLKPEFILGMYDANNKEFAENDKYYENLPEEEQSELLNQTKEQYIKIIEESEMSFKEYSDLLNEFGFENPLTKKDIKEGDNAKQLNFQNIR